MTSFSGVCAGLGGERVRRYRRLCTIALSLVLLHLAAMGLPGWIDPGKWPGALPPITMLSACTVLPAIAARIVRKRLRHTPASTAWRPR
jgi:hypothetical protein